MGLCYNNRSLIKYELTYRFTLKTNKIISGEISANHRHQSNIAVKYLQIIDINPI